LIRSLGATVPPSIPFPML